MTKTTSTRAASSSSPFLTTLLLTLVASGCGAPADKNSAEKNTAEQAAAAKDAAAGKSEAKAEDGAAQQANTNSDDMNDIYSLEAKALDGSAVNLADYRGKVTLFVNVASECGYTPQYAGLQALHSELEDRGFAVLGFPSNDFGGQEPGSADEIRVFCDSKYGVEFPMFAKVGTKAGGDQSPVYAALQQSTGKAPNWNFCKYLVGKDGEVLGFYPSATKPDSAELRQAIEAALE